MTGEHEAKPALSWWARTRADLGRRARKAWAGGVAGATAVVATISFMGFWADGKIDTGKVATAAGSIVTGFVGGFLTVFFAKNAPDPAGQELQPALYEPSTTDYRTQQADDDSAAQ